MKTDPTIFKAYDIRGIYPEQINEEAVYAIAQAFAKFLGPKTVALGRDVRLSGPSLWEAAKNGLIDHGVNVIDIGVISTDMYYFAVANYGFDAGITISASHNPKEYNGMKMVRKGALPISGDTGIKEIMETVLSGYKFKAETKGTVEKKDIVDDYLKKCLSFVDAAKLKPFKVVANGMFGPVLKNVMRMGLPITIIPLNEVPDGNFPKGQPDPAQEANRKETEELIKKEHPDFGVAWDADADRFFLFDENGRFIPGYYLTAFFGRYFASKVPGAKVIYDPRAVWATVDLVREAGGKPLISKAGHSFIKERMRKEDAVFAGEMSGHFYFRDFYYADNGLIPFLLLLEIFSQSDQKVSQIFDPFFEKYPMSGEINIKIESPDQVNIVLAKLETEFPGARIEKIDGLSLEFPDWRANVRGSNTEPLLRINLEAKTPELVRVYLEKIKSPL
ncbi:MAG: phosphomannomutase/phosphoglucomutase [Acidobacteriaceae bacterium]